MKAKKYYFDASEDDHEHCYTMDYFKRKMKNEDIKELTLIEAKVVYGTGFFYCKEYQEIGQVGDVLRPFEELKEKAIRVYTNASRINLQRKLGETKNLLENVEVNALAYFDAQIESYNVIGF